MFRYIIIIIYEVPTVSQKSAADQIWEDSQNGRLMTILKKNLLRGLDPEKLSHLTMRINIMQEEYQTACEILAGIYFFI